MRTLLPLQLPDNTPGGSFHQVPIESGTPDRPEFSEAECDIDTLKKLKLGMRSSLWSRPTVSMADNGGGGVIVGGSSIIGTSVGPPQSQHRTGHPSDYSIAV